jgi:tripartite-type tricarboxylate transporter receptor subunit TctC
MIRLARWSVLLLWAACMFAGAAQAQGYPNKPVFIVVGPGPDALARVVAQKMTEALGQQVLVDVQPAGGGVIAERRVAMSPPDGYTMLFTTGTYSINEALRPSLPVKILRDFEPVALIGTLSFVLVTSPAHPAKTLDDMISLARQKPGEINCASSGVGTTAHLGCEMLRHTAKIEITHIPYRGLAGAIVDIIGQRVEMVFANTTVVPQVKAGELRPLAVTGPSRLSTIPEVPTVAELGYPDVEFQSWNGLHVPAGTPQDVIEKIHAAIEAIVKTPDMRQRMEDLGYEPGGGTTGEFAEFVKKDLARWERVVKTTGVKLD